jgi:hypothetical protein
MHLVDITMFYAAEGGGVSTYLNAKAQWLARRSRVQHTIISSNVETCDATQCRRWSHSRRRPARLPWFPHAAVGVHAGAPARIGPSDLVEAGDAGHCAWAALRMRKRYDIPAVAFYHSDLPRLVRPRLGRWAARGTCRYLANLYGQFDLVLAPSRVMVQQLDDHRRARRRAPAARHRQQRVPSAAPRRHAARCTSDSIRTCACWSTPAASRPRRSCDLLVEAVRKLGAALPPDDGRQRRRTARRPTSPTFPSSATSASWRACWPAATCWCIPATARPSA